jgi:hypothetical protein
MKKLQKCVNFVLTVPVFFATNCTNISCSVWIVISNTEKKNIQN